MKKLCYANGSYDVVKVLLKVFINEYLEDQF